MRTMLAAGLALIAVPALAAAQGTTVEKQIIVEKSITKDGAAADAADPAIKAIVDNCAVRKFETSVEFAVDGKQRRTKIKLCAKPGESEAAWANTLAQAAKTIEANATIPAEAKAKIVADINAEIAGLKVGAN